jgi:hypothetical protein
VSRRRLRIDVQGGGVREAYVARLRKQWEGRAAWGHFGRIVDRIERGEPVVVPAWAVRRWTGFPASAFGGPGFLELRPDGDVVPVVPVRSADGLRISRWRSPNDALSTSPDTAWCGQPAPRG